MIPIASRRIHLIGVVVATATLCTMGSIRIAQAQPAGVSLFDTPWQSLFNGQDLSGWEEIGEEKWVVEDGVIYGEGITDEYGYLATEREYGSFHLSLRFKCEADGNSGVYLHTQFAPGTTKVVRGRQIEIDRTLNHHTGGIYGDQKGWIAWPAAEYETVIRPDAWNDMLIRVEGSRYVVILNGIEILDYTYPNPPTSRGRIALQLHSGGEGRMRFKDIFIRDFGGRDLNRSP